MSNLENEFNKRFSNQKLPGEGFENNDLWNAISEDLDEVSSKENNEKRRRILPLIFLVVGVIGFFCIKNDAIYIPGEVSTEPSEFVIELEKDKGNDFEKSEQIQKEILDAKLLTIENLREKTNLKAKSQEQEIHSFEISNIRPDSQVLNDFSQIKNIQKKTIPHLQLEASTEQNSKKKSLKVEDVLLPELPIIVSLLETNMPNPPSFQHFVFEKENSKKNQSKRFQIGLVGGVNTLHLNYRSDELSNLANDKNTAEKEIAGISLGVNSTVIFNKNWLLNTGFEYHQLYSKFEYKHQKQFQSPKENQVLKIWLDEATGDILNQLRGDTVVNSRSTRQVLHYNTYERFSIPLEIGLQKNIGKVVLGIQSGVHLNFTVAESGKTLNKAGDIISFKTGDTATPFKKTSIGLSFGSFCTYQLADNWLISLRPRWVWERKSKVEGVDMKIAAHQFNLNFGVGYSFD